jgi:hypothetical protein
MVSDPEGLTPAIPGGRSCAYDALVAACDGALGSSTQRGSDRRLEGRPSCWRTQIQEACCDRCRRSASNGRGVRRPPKGTWPELARKGRPRLQLRSGAQSRRHAGAARQPRGPLKRSRRARRSGSRGGIAMPPGAGGQPAPGQPMRRPRTRRTSRRPPGPRGRHGACVKQSPTKKIDIGPLLPS